MRILIIGGTHFVGHGMAQAALDARPRRDPAAPQRDRRAARRDPPAGRPRRRPVGARRRRAGTPPSTCAPTCRGRCDASTRRSATAAATTSSSPRCRCTRSRTGPGADEDAARSSTPAPEDGDGGHQRDLRPAQGRLRARRPRAVRRRAGWRSIRPTYVVGPRDATARYPWWPLRAARGGPMIVPGPAEAPMQCIDARDMGAWTVRLAEDRVTGAFTAARPRDDVRALLDETVGACRQRRRAGAGRRRLAGRAGRRRAPAAAVDRGRRRSGRWRWDDRAAEAPGLTAPAVRGGRPRHPGLGAGQPRPGDEPALGPGARARAGAARRLAATQA